MIHFENIKACVFDAYGTLFDVHSAVGRYKSSIGESADAVSALWRSKQLEYTWLRSLMGKHRDFWRITGDALDYAMDACDVNDPALRDNLMRAYLALDAYPEVKDVLGALREAGYKTAILSNGSPNMLQAAVDSAGINDLLDACLSIEEVGIFKPHPKVYRLAVERLEVDAAQISFQSSNAWDAVGAATFGMRVAWVNRFYQKRERLTADPQAEIGDLRQLLTVLGV